MIAVRPFEPVGRLVCDEGLRPMPVPEALAIVQDARGAARTAFPVRAARHLRGDIHPWQLAAALAFERGHPRVLVADAAGMGKTVSAAIAIAECLDGASDRRCLVLAPGHLLRQWQGELHGRLLIDATILDAPALTRMLRDIPAGIPVWSLPGCLIASIDFVKQPHIVRSLEPAVWDLVVIDEAHLACGVTERRETADLIARRARRLLLLTATPSDGGSGRLRTLLSLGGGAAPFIHLRHVAVARDCVERQLRVAPAPQVAALHEALAAYTQWIAGDGGRELPAVPLLCSLLTKRALSSAHAVRISLERRLALLGAEPPAWQPSLFEPEDDPGVLGAGTRRPVQAERHRLEHLLELADRAARHDRRVDALLRLVRRAREPVVVFTCFRDTAVLLAGRLAPMAAVRLIHGELPAAVIETALQAFTAGPARVLVATDVISQGLNLQHRCRWIVHYDLPWRPPGLRQRLGRVDRLGQTRRAHATFLIDRTDLAAGMSTRMRALIRRMEADERAGPARWDVLAAAEAERIAAGTLRDPGVAGRAPLPPAITVVETEHLDGSGATIERTVAAVNAAEAPALQWAEAHAARRRRQLARALSARRARRQRREREVLAAALGPAAAALRQQGLFDRRADRARQHDTALRGQLAESARAAGERHALEGRVAESRTRTIATFLIAGI